MAGNVHGAEARAGFCKERLLGQNSPQTPETDPRQAQEGPKRAPREPKRGLESPKRAYDEAEMCTAARRERDFLKGGLAR
jgi:hypothetical protein